MDIFSNFNAAEIEPASGAMDLLPAGKYVAMIVANETRATKKGDGKRLNLTFEIVDGEFKGRKVWHGLNIENPNPQAVEISMRELSAICRAVGVMTPKGADDLQDRPMEISVKIRPASGDYAASNEINGFKAVGKVVSQPSTASTPPWKK